MEKFEIRGDESMKELADKMSNLKTFKDKYGGCLTILTYLKFQYGGNYTFEISNMDEKDLTEEPKNAKELYSLFPGLYLPLTHFLFYLKKNDIDMYDYLKESSKRINEEETKKQKLKFYVIIAFIFIAIVVILNYL
jgi:ubiquinone/menaquinone biosynthesis C-methylase UbiE